MAAQIPLQCVVCCKEFSGPVPAQQHFSSQEHLRKVENSKRQHSELFCTVCKISCDTMKIMREHMQSPRHQEMEKKQRMFTAQSHPQTDRPRNCEFPGTSNTEYVFSRESLKGYCYLCDIVLTSQSHAESHINGKAHKKKSANNKQSHNWGRQNQVPTTPHPPPFRPTGLLGPNSSDIGYRPDRMMPQNSNFAHHNMYGTGTHTVPDRPQPLQYIKCDVCQVTMSGPENAREHFASEKHKKKQAQANGQDTVGTVGQAGLSCLLCNVGFTGPESEAAHMVSKKHKKKEKQLELERKGEALPLTCNACGCTFTGQECAEAHFASEKHKRNFANKQIQSGVSGLYREGQPQPNRFGNPEARSCEGLRQDYTNFVRKNINIYSEDMFRPKTDGLQDKLSQNIDRLGYREADSDSSEESLELKPVDKDEDELKPNEKDEDESLFLKPVESVEDTLEIKPFLEEGHDNLPALNSLSSMMDEMKIKAETDASLMVSTTEGESVSSRGTDSCRVFRNDLEFPSIGRGRGIFSMLQTYQGNTLPGKVENKDPDNEKIIKTETDAGETFSKVVWSNNLEYESGISKTIRKEIYRPTTDIAQVETEVKIKAEPFAATNPDENIGHNQFTHTGKPSSGIEPRIGLPFNPNQRIPAPISNPENGNITGFQFTPNRSEQSFDFEEYVFDEATGRGMCNICDIAFTSRNHMNQHISGKNHLKAREVRRLLAEKRGVAGSSLVCTLCAVTFTGPEARAQHMHSERHKQRERRHCIESDKNEFFCDICKVACSGPESFQQHQMGAQHRKRASTAAPTGDVNPDIVYDRTQWFPCEVCKCNMNTYEQLKIHEQSPKHIKQLEKHRSVGHVNLQDRTLWYPCNVCNCNMNSAEQLRIHEASPAHIAKMTKIQTHGQVQLSPLYIPPRSEFRTEGSNGKSSSSGDSLKSPLESFLSEELFPEQFLPREKEESPSDVAVRETLVMTDEPFQIPPSNATISNRTVPHEVNGAEEGSGGAKRGQGSDLAWATRNRSSRENGNVKKADGSPDYSSQGARPKQASPTENNPYAATHRYFCHTCNAPANTREAYENHIRGKRHMQKVCTEPAPNRDHIQPLTLSEGFLPLTETQPRSYQVELYRKAMEDDTLCFLPTGTGKTLVAVMTISAMLHKYPSKNVLFLVDKVLLVLQQAKYIVKEIGKKEFHRYSPDSDDCLEMVARVPRIASVCMGQQATGGVPLWQHDVVVVTAAFCQNLLDKKILRWEDFSLVVFDEAHHCEKGHPFNVLLTNYHRRIRMPQNKPKVLGLTASPAGKADVEKTFIMLQGLVGNMGGVRMSIVEEPENKRKLAEYQSNAQMIIKTHADKSTLIETNFRRELDIYITQCVLKLLQISNIGSYLDVGKDISLNMSDESVRNIASDFVEKNIDVIQSSINSIDTKSNEAAAKIELSSLRHHVQAVCMAVSCLEEGGILIAMQELEDLQATEYNFDFARGLGLPTAPLKQLISGQTRDVNGLLSIGEGGDASEDVHVRRLIEELTATDSLVSSPSKKSISLVLVKQRCTAHHITKVLQNSERMRRLGLNTTYVVGHGGSGAADTGMSVNQQKRILEEIKQFMYQVVIATSVAEEGVDWPECDRVISMYPPSTVTALVQMRGRARKKYSKFIVLCSSLAEEEKLQDIMKREENMIIATQMLIEQSRSS